MILTLIGVLFGLGRQDFSIEEVQWLLAFLETMAEQCILGKSQSAKTTVLSVAWCICAESVITAYNAKIVETVVDCIEIGPLLKIWRLNFE